MANVHHPSINSLGQKMDRLRRELLKSPTRCKESFLKELRETEYCYVKKDFNLSVIAEEMRVKKCIEIEVNRRRSLFNGDEVESCPICFEEIFASEIRGDRSSPVYICCGKVLCIACHREIMKRGEKAYATLKSHFVSTEERKEAKIDLGIADRCPCCQTTLFHTDEESLNIIQKHVERKRFWALRFMCRSYQNGEYGLEQDKRKALEFCLMAAEAGDPWSEYQTSLFYRSGIAFGMTFTKSLTKFLHWLRLSADHGCMFAQFDLGYILKLGKILPQDLNATHRLYTLAASQGLVSAIHHLGLRAHHLGEQNTCVYWLCKAADLGHVESITSLAACLAENPFHIRSRFDSFDPLPGYSSLPLTLRLLQRIPMNDAKHIFVKEFIMPKLNTWKRICAGCGRQMTRSDLRACSQCNIFYYCGKKCQMQHWNSGHKRDCNTHWLGDFFPDISKPK